MTTVYCMISATTQALAEFLSRELSTIDTEQISFNHPMLSHLDYPGLNVYCYHVQARRGKPSMPVPDNSSTQTWEANDPLAAAPSPDVGAVQGVSQWFDLSFLISVNDYTALGEQYLLSEIISVLSNRNSLPEEILAPELQGRGALPLRVSDHEWSDTVKLWDVLCAPLRPALQVRITVPSLSHRHQVYA